MRRWRMARPGLQSLVFVALLLVSCAAPGSDNPEEGCGGTEAAISCLNITGIRPTSVAGGESSNVDAFQEVCLASSGAVTAEPFTDHNAQITFTNTRFPTATITTGFDIRITGYAVSYRLNQCPTAARGCPPLTGFTVSGESILIPAGQSASVTLPFVPLRVKNEYCVARGESGAAMPSYTAVYTFTAQTTRFNDTFTVIGNSQFTIGDFLATGFSCTGTLFVAPC